MCAKFKILTHNHTPPNSFLPYQADTLPSWESMRPHSHFRQTTERTGASTDEPQLNMMREMTDGARESHSSICPLWMALMNVYPDLLKVNSFLRLSRDHGVLWNQLGLKLTNHCKCKR